MQIVDVDRTQAVPGCFKKVGHPDGIDTCFSRIDAESLIKVYEATKLLDSFLFITFNPPPFLNISNDDSELEEYLMYEQHAWCMKKLNKWAHKFHLYFKSMCVVFEQTQRGVIHMHFIVEKRDPDMIDTDIKKILWLFFDINLSNCRDKKQRDAISNNCVHIRPIDSMEKCLDYLFNKDKKDYETLYNKKHNGEYLYSPLILQSIPVTDGERSEPGTSDSNSESESEEREIALKKYLHVKLKLQQKLFKSSI